MKHMISKYAICPYYRHEDTQVIYCDGVTDDSVTHLAFASKTIAKEYKQCYCYKDFNSCLISQMLQGRDEQ